MARLISLGAAQLGPIAKDESKADVVERLIALLHDADEQAIEVLVYPELALTTFFPRWWIEDPSEFDHYYHSEMPDRDTQPLFDEAKRLGIGFALGYAELSTDGDGTVHRYNTTILVDGEGKEVGKYRKVHIPGHSDHEPWREFQHAERHYFEPGDDFPVYRGFGGLVGMAISNDRLVRFSKAFRQIDQVEKPLRTAIHR